MAFDKSKTLETAEKFVAKNQYEKAVREFQKVMEVDPDDDRVQLRMAYCYEEMGHDDEAARIYINVASAYQSQGVYQKALAMLKQAQKKRPNDEEIAMNMAELYNVLGLPHEAMSQLEKCLEHSKNNRIVYGRVLQMMVRVDSENIQTRTQYGQYLYEDGDIEGAKRQYALALAQLLSKERYVDYVQLARQYFRIDPQETNIIREVAKIYIRMDRYDDAVNLVSTLPPDNIPPELREILITCYTKRKRYDKAVKELKTLAKQYISEGKREDIVEEVWLRAQQLAPNDPEIAEALGGDIPPMLSDSALNIIPQNVNGVAPIGGISESERIIAHMFNQAMEYYRIGNIEDARSLCNQIIDSNERHMPALQLLSQIYESRENYPALAQIERKLARAVFDNDPNEAVRHVLKAEKATPKAWENFNLMLVFGLNPSDYGMSAPGSSHSGQSEPRISPAALEQITGFKQPAAGPAPIAPIAGSPKSIPRPPAPGSLPAAQTGKPSIPPPINARQRATTISAELSLDRVQSTMNQQAVQPADNPIQPFGRASSGSRPILQGQPNALPTSNASQAQDSPFGRVPSGIRRMRPPTINRPTSSLQLGVVNISQVDVASGKSNNTIEQLSSAVTDELDDAFDALFQPQATTGVQDQSPQTPEDNYTNTARYQNHFAEQNNYPQNNFEPSLPDQAKPTPSYVKLPAIKQPDNFGERMPDPAQLAQQSAIPTPIASSAVPLNVMTSSLQTETMPAEAVQSEARIPESERQRVIEAIQEIEFYVSLALLDDAKNMLETLIQEFGDIDIIHDEKIKLNAM